jgi:hypothetical protein
MVNKLLQEIIESGNISVMTRGGTWLVARYDFANLLDWLSEKAKYAVLGADGFIFDGKSITPLMECIIDLSDADPKETINIMKEVLAQNEELTTKPHFYELVIKELD